MQKAWRFFLLVLLAVGILLLAAPTVKAQDQCVPAWGMINGWYTDTWHGTIALTIGRTVHTAKLNVVNTSFYDDGNVYRGTETWTLDFGKGDTFQVKTHFVTEHMTDLAAASGVFHVTEVGQITNGTGQFYKVYGSFYSDGPFGPNVRLAENVKVPADAQMRWHNAGHGTICYR
jgi:hypothetical protein